MVKLYDCWTIIVKKAGFRPEAHVSGVYCWAEPAEERIRGGAETEAGCLRNSAALQGNFGALTNLTEPSGSYKGILAY
ncbi:hypothetical protein D3C75_725480 [compost metagenome]